MGVPGPTPGDRRRGHEHAPIADPFHAAKVLGRVLYLASAAEEENHLGAGLSFQMDVGGESDVFAPTMLRRGEATQHVRRVVPVEQQETSDRIGLWVLECLSRQLLTNQGSDGLGTAPGIPLADPAVQNG